MREIIRPEIGRLAMNEFFDLASFFRSFVLELPDRLSGVIIDEITFFLAQ